MVGIYLMFNRNCREALKLYEEALGAKIIEIMRYGDMPVNPDFTIPEEDKNLVLHARFEIGGMEIMGADSGRDPEAGSNMLVTLTTRNADFLKGAWELLRKDGKVYMELEPSFFAPLHGSLRDAFGINWMFTLEK